MLFSRKTVIAISTGIALSAAGCTTLDSTPALVKVNEVQQYQFTAKKTLLFTGRRIYIFSNGLKVMEGKARYWSDRITMTGSLDHKPISATCAERDKAEFCDILLAGEPVASLQF